VKVVKHQTKPYAYAWVLTDTTMFFLAGGALEHNRYPYLVANRADEPRTLAADIVGHSCFADIIVLGGHVPACEEGDVVAFLETGAYQESSTSNFNALPRPASILVHGDEAEVIKRAESPDDVWARDEVPDRVRTEPRGATRATP
jgi:diaminopimelate decarboxylase